MHWGKCLQWLFACLRHQWLPRGEPPYPCSLAKELIPALSKSLDSSSLTSGLLQASSHHDSTSESSGYKNKDAQTPPWRLRPTGMQRGHTLVKSSQVNRLRPLEPSWCLLLLWLHDLRDSVSQAPGDQAEDTQGVGYQSVLAEVAPAQSRLSSGGSDP